MSSDLLVRTLAASTCVVAVLGLAAAAVRSHRPAIANSLWRAALLSFWIAPIAILVGGAVPVHPVAVPVPRIQLSRPSPKPTAMRSQGPHAASAHTNAEPQPPPPADQAPAARRRRVDPREFLPEALLLVWLLGAAALQVSLIRDVLRVRGLVRRGVGTEEEALAQLVPPWARRVGLKAPPGVIESAEVPVPVVVSYLRPALVVPPALGGELPGLEALLVHELAHIRRADLLMGALARVTCVLWWWNPLTWLVARALAESAEEACDAWAVELTGQRREYARLLVRWAHASSVGAAVSVTHRGRHLLGRLRNVLDEIPRGPLRTPFSLRAGLVLAVALVPLLWAGPRVRAGDAQGNAGRAGGMRLVQEGDLDPQQVKAIADVVGAAKAKMDTLFPEAAKKQITLNISPRDSWWPNTVTDRDRTIYVQIGEIGGRGIGEFARADAGPVGMLCQAVAELHNPLRLPGLDRFVAHRYLVPAVVEALGPEPISSDAATPLAADGPDMLALITDVTYAALHPDFAAAGALARIDDALGLQGLQSLIAGIPAGAADPFAALREAAVARDPALGPAFGTYDEATRVEVGEDGSVLIASFEEDETVTPVADHPLPAVYDPLVLWPTAFDAIQTDEWSSEGTQSLKLSTTAPRADMGFGFSDPDWRLKDWSRFTRFDMDVRLEGNEPEAIQVRIDDDIALGHGELELFRGALQPGETRHIACSLDPRTVRGYKSSHGRYYGGSFRWNEVAALVLLVKAPTQPFAIYIDDLRLATGELGALDRPAGIVSDFEEDDLPLWRGLTPEYELVTEGDSAGRWEHMDQVPSVTFTMPMDWSPYEFLEFDCLSETANNDRFILCIQSMDKPRPGGGEDYWAYVFGVDWAGWRHFRIPFRRLLHIRQPAGWDKVTAIRMWANGWGMSANPDTKLVFDNMRLSEGEPRTVPQGLVDDFEDGPWAWWWMDEGSVPAHSGEHCGEFPLNTGWREALCNPLTTDWGPYKELRLWAYTDKLDGEVLLMHAGGNGGRLEAEVPLDGEGWREVVLPLTPNPGQVTSLELSIRNLHGDDFGVANRQLDPEAKLCLDDIRLE